MKRMVKLQVSAFLAFAALATVATAQNETRIIVDAAAPMNVSKSGDDIAQIKRLALNVGSEFATNRVTEEYLKSLRIKTLRLINVGISGRFDEQGAFIDITPSPRLERDLALCQRLNANPHIIISSLPDQLLKSVPLKVTRHKALGIDFEKKHQKIGPTDYKLLENWYLSYFEYIKIRLGFKAAVFEIFNEPDLGMMIYPSDDIPPKGSDAAYDCMLKIYRAASAAGKRFEELHPDCKLLLGGPQALAFTYKLGDKGWAKRFVADCSKENLKLDFLGLHHYGNISPFRGESRDLSNYPSLPDMLAGIRSVSNKTSPNLPVWLTEYGAHCNVAGKVGEINANSDGAAFSLDCLDAMLELNIDSAIYLVTTDQMRMDEKSKARSNGFSWCSFMVSPDWLGYPYPKAPFHAYKMVSELEGRRVFASSSGGKVKAFAAFDHKAKDLRILLWNYATYIPEVEPMIEEGKNETVRIEIANADLPPDAKAVLRSVDKEHGDVFSAYQANRPVNLAAATPAIAFPSLKRENGKLVFEVAMQPASIAMLEIGGSPAIPSLLTPYSEEAEILLKTMRSPQSDKALEVGAKILELPGLRHEQHLDALKLLTIISGQMKDYDKANAYAQASEKLCAQLNKPLPFAVARRLGDAERESRKFPAAIERYRQALSAPDCDWRSRFGTDLAITDCFNAEGKLQETVAFCDSTLAGDAYDKHPELKGDFRLRKLEALRSLGQTEASIATYKELMEGEGNVNTKLGGVISIVGLYGSQQKFDEALAEGGRGLALKDGNPALLNKLKSLLQQIESSSKVKK